MLSGSRIIWNVSVLRSNCGAVLEHQAEPQIALRIGLQIEAPVGQPSRCSGICSSCAERPGVEAAENLSAEI
jgi:hypothetical protein